MKAKYYLLIITLLISVSYSSQNIDNHYKQIEGIWKGNFEEKSKKYVVSLNVSNSPRFKDSYNFTLTNFTNDRFYVTKSKIMESTEKTFTIVVEEAGLSSCENCKFTKGTITIKTLDNNTIELSVTSVGPSYWRTYDVEQGMTDISNLILIRDHSTK
ncbi:hypothetical protein NZ698_02345 [Chryseobacterium sp. PBS4-4]|uniref:Lipocalin-like domain-containing protein n=1 Tax=Chryseobacterium edaphi TaxID=2976532 RepID=A0ABT2W5M6_9FLAO|nr:hypothetical protein [Chryseobacterium edaphi]MCU7616025.1 hypothetical protein [Chryseobacterium edaphi]